MINEVAIAMTFPSLLHRDGGRDIKGKKNKKTKYYHSLQFCVQRATQEFLTSTPFSDGSWRLFGREHLSEPRGEGAGMMRRRRKAFSTLECFSVCNSESVGLLPACVFTAKIPLPTIVISVRSGYVSVGKSRAGLASLSAGVRRQLSLTVTVTATGVG